MQSAIKSSFRMYKRATLIFFLLAFFFFAKPVRAQDVGGPVYVVQAGDTLFSIAARFNVDLNALMAVNHIANPSQIDVGQQLVIPGLEGVTGALNTEVLNFGDSYRSLIRRTQVPQNIFRKLNHVVSPSEFYVGVSMIVPTRSESKALTARFSAGAGESLLELAVKQNTDTWTLAHYNRLQGSWDAIPGDTLFTTGGADAQSVSGLPSAFINAEIVGLPLKQGGTVAIKALTIPNATLSGFLIDHPLHFFPTADGTQVALQGAHALLPPGVYPLRLDATLPDGTIQSYEQFILVVTGNYLTGENLSVDPSLIDPAVTDPEQRQLADLTLPATPTKYWDGVFISPASAYAESTYFTSRYGTRRTYLGAGTDLKVNWWHTGLDFGGGNGLAIVAPAAGQIVFAGPLTVRGNATIIDHGWGVYSGFWHQSVIQVNVGDIVQQNQTIGLVGGTGRVTGAHLHWELWVNGIQVDPMDWLTQPYP
jgi:murein DD-endopeptidase MepM/ murein hydrolase activator NlpD